MTITYDQMGNPLNDGTWTYTWEHGRQLASMAKSGTTWTYTYDANGMRTSRSNGTDTYTYVYNGSKLMQMKKGAYTLDFTYDGSGNPSTVTLNGATYYYITNLQGDVVEIRNTSGGLVCYYAYDAWGNVVATTSSTHAIVQLNPLLYRGYVYDADTGLYYLQSRYYNPTIGRFINADVYTSTDQGMLGNNMFAYCLNNPVNRIDTLGLASVWWYFIEVHDMGFIHRAVQAHIYANYIGVETEFTILGGRADIKVDTAVWEVKHAGMFPEIRAQIAKAQARKYINNAAITCLGAVNTFSGSFYIQCGEIAIYVEYSTPIDGAILYTVEEVKNYNGSYFRKFVTLEQRNKKKQMKAMPNYFTQPSVFFDGGGAMMAMYAIICAGCCLLPSRNWR